MGQALAHAHRLLEVRPDLAAEQAAEILKVTPGQVDAIIVLARARTAMGDAVAGLAALRSLTEPPAAPGPAALRAMAEALTLSGDTAAADEAHRRAVVASIHDAVLMNAGLALREGRLNPAEAALRARLKAEPTDVSAIRMLAEVAAQIGRYGDAEVLLSRVLELHPSFREARHAHAQVLLRQERPLDALAQAERLVAEDPSDIGSLMLQAAVQARLGEQTRAAELYEALLARGPGNPMGWMSYGHVLKTIGRSKDGIEAYRRAVDIAPQLGEAWWSLANLKTFRFTPEDVAILRAQLARTDLSEDDRLHLHYALGKAEEDAGAFQTAFEQYGHGAAIRRAQLRYDPADTTEHVRQSVALLTSAFFAERADVGCPAPDPIFVIGLPRSGSTLVEQILSSHSHIEGTAELPDMTTLVKKLGDRVRPGGGRRAYLEALGGLSPEDFAALGQSYLDATRVQRKTARPLFIDKLPNNWLHVGLIHLILPKAKIIDARRHPLGCCLSGFKQHFARGQAFSYGLEDIGLYYRDYVTLMAHIDQVLPGRVHRVIYEHMIADTEGEIRRLLDYMGLPFEPACLEFHRTERAVRTASSEQVRQPIFSDGVDHWRHFEPWLDPLKRALGPVLDSYPQAP